MQINPTSSVPKQPWRKTVRRKNIKWANDGRVVVGNKVNHVHVGERFPTVILRCDVPYVNPLNATIDCLWASPHTMDVPSGTVPQIIEGLRTATRTIGGLHVKRLHHGRDAWILHRVHVEL